jgi:DNA-binding XRE family transcriptional regulator
MTGSELRGLRKAAGWQAQQLAEAMDVSAATMSKYETGKAAIPVKVELAARYLCQPGSSPQKPAAERLVEAMKELVNG